MVDVSKLGKTVVFRQYQRHMRFREEESAFEIREFKTTHSHTQRPLSKQCPRLLEVTRNALENRLPGTLVLLPDYVATTFSVNLASPCRDPVLS